MTAKKSKRGGRPRLSPEERRSLSLPAVKVTPLERIRIESKAEQAGLTVSDWIRFTAQERTPPRRAIVPKINQDAWSALGLRLNELHKIIWQIESNRGTGKNAVLLEIKEEIKSLRNALLGTKK